DRARDGGAVLLLVPDGDAHGAGAQLADGGAAPDHQLGALALPVTARRSLPRRRQRDRGLGRSAPPSGTVPAAARSARRACARAPRAPSRRRAWSTGRGPPAAA